MNKQEMPTVIPLPNNIILVAVTKALAPQINATINKNKQHLQRWLIWADNNDTVPLSSTQEFISKQQDAQDEMAYSITKDDDEQMVVIGGVGTFPEDAEGTIYELGYWLDADFQGQGIALAATRMLVKLLFLQFDTIKTLQIKMNEYNTRSKAIPEKLGFSFSHLYDNPWQSEAPLQPYQTGKHAVYKLNRETYMAQQQQTKEAL